MLNALKRRGLERLFARCYAWRLDEFTRGQAIELDYPVDPRPRYSSGHPHPELWAWFDRQRSACAATLDVVSSDLSTLERIPSTTADPHAPFWNNIFFSALDAMTLHALIGARRPRRIVEVGSGNSTKFMRHTIDAHHVHAELVSIDPRPRAEIDGLCTRVVRQRLETVDQQLFSGLTRGDLLFIDSSHRAFTNSDVTTFFLEILPRLPSGVVVHVHDIFLPWDYPAEWSGRYYSEQYLMACWLLAGPERCRLVASNAFVSFDARLRDTLNKVVAGSLLASMFGADATYGGIAHLAGVSLWIEMA